MVLKRYLLKVTYIIVFITIILIAGFVVVRFGSALTQEGNPLPYLISITKYELSNSGYAKVLQSNDNTYISKFEKKYPFGMAIEFMKSHGWTFKEQIGSGLVFEKNNKIITISTRQYSKHYFLWKVPKTIIP